MDPASIAYIIATLASAAMSYKSSNDAAKRQKQLAVEAQQRQLNAQNQAADVAAKKAAEFDPTQRQDRQQQIEQALTGELQQQVAQPQITAQGVQVGTTVPQGQGGADYLAAKAKEQAKATASLRGLAAVMGRIGSAGELRRNEAIGFGDASGQVGRIQNGADVLGGIDQIGIDSVRPNIGLQLASEATRAYGTYQGNRAAMQKPANVNAGSAWA